MSRNCIEFGSSNTQKKGVSLFGFPNDAKMKRAWTVKYAELGTRGKEHFSEDCLNPHQSPPNKVNWASEASPTQGCSIEILRGAKRAHAQSQYWAVKSDQ